MDGLSDHNILVFGIMPHMFRQDEFKFNINIVIHSHVTHELVKSEIHVSVKTRETAFWRENGRFHGRITCGWAIRPKYFGVWHHATYV